MSKSNTDPNGQITAFGDRLYRLAEEQRALGEDIRELKKEAKGAGVSPKDIALYARLKRQGREKVNEDRDVREKVLSVLGWLD